MTPPVGAGPCSAADAVNETGDVTLVLIVIVLSVGASTLRMADCVVPFTAALMVTATACGVGVQRERRSDAEVAPAGTVTDAGTVTTVGMLLESGIVSPLSGAGALSVI